MCIRDRDIEMEEYKIYKTNRFNDEILQDIVAIFYSKELAEDFVSYEITLGNNYAIIKDGERIEI